MNRHLIAFYALITLSILVLIYFVHSYPISDFDIYVTREIQKIKLGNFSGVMNFISVFGNGIWMPLSIIFVSLFFYVTYHRREAYFALAIILPDLCNILIKIIISRPRPTIEDANILLNFTQSSFPSGHVIHYVVLFGFILTVMIVKKNFPLFWRILIGIFSGLMILTISSSRIYLGAHWITDVLGGYLFGFIYLGIILRFYLRR